MSDTYWVVRRVKTKELVKSPGARVKLQLYKDTPNGRGQARAYAGSFGKGDNFEAEAACVRLVEVEL